MVMREMPAKNRKTQAAQDVAREPTDRREVRRTAIVETAARLFAEHGYADCEMDRLAGELGIAKGTLYLYFKSKEELFLASVDLGMSQLQAAVRTAATAVDDPLEKVQAGIHAYLQFFDEHPHHVELLIQERANFRRRKRPSYFEHRDANRGPWRELWQGLIAAGRVRADLPVERILDAIGNLVYGTMFTNYFIGRNTPMCEQAHSLMDIIFDGILTERGAASRKGCAVPAYGQK
jgi:AcrR family transcriptional regulator